MATADEEAMGGHRGGLEMGAAKGPVGTISVGGEGHGCGARVFAHHKGGMRWFRESAPGGSGGGGERRGGGSRPALEGTFSLVISFWRVSEATSSFLCLSFVFPYCWWSGRPTMTGQAGPGAREQGI